MLRLIKKKLQPARLTGGHLAAGFEQFYGFLGGATDQWHPELWEGNQKINIEPNKTHLTELLADKAISYIANQKSANTEKPFFLYLAPGATHSPHQAPEEWIKKYKGKFDGGWDKYRETVFNRQKKLECNSTGNSITSKRSAGTGVELIKCWPEKIIRPFYGGICCLYVAYRL